MAMRIRFAELGLLVLATCAGFDLIRAQMATVPPGPEISLLESVKIQQDRICLSDLFPTSATTDIKQIARTIDLGRAPQAGSFRVFTAEQLGRAIDGRLSVRIPEKVVVYGDTRSIHEGEAIQRTLAQERLSRSSIAVTQKSYLVRPGTPSALVLREEGMTITLHVLPLKRATLGEGVRVMDPSTHRIFLARVKAENTLETNFEEKHKP